MFKLLLYCLYLDIVIRDFFVFRYFFLIGVWYVWSYGFIVIKGKLCFVSKLFSVVFFVDVVMCCNVFVVVSVIWSSINVYFL